VIGGVALVGLTYWFVYLRPEATPVSAPTQTTSAEHISAQAAAPVDGRQG